jgi:hypothetical protein
MGQFQPEEPRIIPPKLRLIAIVVHRIARALLEKKQTEAGSEEFDEFILLFGSAIRNLPKQIVQLREIVPNRFLKPKDQIATLLGVPVVA